MIAPLLAAALAAQNPAPFTPAPPAPARPLADQQIRDQRQAFNGAIARGDLVAIATFLAENAQIVTGRSSLVFNGRAAQIGMWWEDLQAPDRQAYIRTPDRIELSPIAEMAMETGHWRGTGVKSPGSWASGTYSAKWRRIGGQWRIESEIYMTTACAGNNCPKPK